MQLQGLMCIVLEAFFYKIGDILKKPCHQHIKYLCQHFPSDIDSLTLPRDRRRHEHFFEATGKRFEENWVTLFYYSTPFSTANESPIEEFNAIL